MVSLRNLPSFGCVSNGKFDPRLEAALAFGSGLAACNRRKPMVSLRNPPSFGCVSNGKFDPRLEAALAFGSE
jgi:hypothetical protein